MPFDIPKLDAEIRRLQTIRELMNDPESRAALEKFVTSNGKHPKPDVAKKPLEQTVNADVPLNGGSPRKYGEMKKYVLEVLSSTPKTLDQIVEQMIVRGFKPTAKSTKASLARVLGKLETKGEAKRAGKAKYGTFMWTK